MVRRGRGRGRGGEGDARPGRRHPRGREHEPQPIAPRLLGSIILLLLLFLLHVLLLYGHPRGPSPPCLKVVVARREGGRVRGGEGGGGPPLLAYSGIIPITSPRDGLRARHIDYVRRWLRRRVQVCAAQHVAGHYKTSVSQCAYFFRYSHFNSRIRRKRTVGLPSSPPARQTTTTRAIRARRTSPPPSSAMQTPTPASYVVRLSGALAALLGRAEGAELPEDDLLGWLRAQGLITYPSPRLEGLLGGELPEVFAAKVLPQLDPTDLALFARVGPASRAAVVASGLPRAGTSEGGPLKLNKLCTVEGLAWAEVNGYPGVPRTCGCVRSKCGCRWNVKICQAWALRRSSTSQLHLSRNRH